MLQKGKGKRKTTLEKSRAVNCLVEKIFIYFLFNFLTNEKWSVIIKIQIL